VSFSRSAAIAVVAVLAWVGYPVPVAAQADSAAQAPFHLGPIGVSPTIRLTNVGWDSNVYNQNSGSNPPSDFTSAFRPSVDALMNSPRFNLAVHSQWDYYYFRRLSSLRALDIDQSARVDATLNRLSPYVGGSWLTTRHRQNLEIDAIVRRRNSDVLAGTFIRLSAKTALDVHATRATVDYEGGELFRGAELAPALNHSSIGGGVAVRYQATPLTSFAVGVSRGRTRFASSPERNNENWSIGPSVEFKPLALISGIASVAFQRTTFRDTTQPEFSSIIATVNLQYTLHGRTQFSVTGQRNLEYSYLETQRDYVLAGAGVTVTHRLHDRWDVDGSIGRYGLSYRRHDGATGLQRPPTQAFSNYGTSLGYRFGRHRLAFDLDYGRRDADIAAHEYDRLRVGSSLTYVF
jgi:hypothetical protein